MKFLKIIKEILFPSNFKCVLCNEEMPEGNNGVCAHCLHHLPYIKGKTCEICGEEICSDANYCLSCKSNIPHFNKAVALFNYEGGIARLIKELKYDNKQYLKQTLGNFMVETYKKLDVPIDLVIPVPLHKNRFKERGYNQAELLSESLKTKFGLCINTEILERKRDTSTQTSLKKRERITNMKDAFAVNNKKTVKDKNILLVDDVYTTGSTLNEIARVLKDSGAKNVFCVTLAHTNIENALETKKAR